MWPHVRWPRSFLPTALHPCPFPLHPQLLYPVSMDSATMEALMERMIEKRTDKVLCACVSVFLLASRPHFLPVFSFKFQ